MLSHVVVRRWHFLFRWITYHQVLLLLVVSARAQQADQLLDYGEFSISDLDTSEIKEVTCAVGSTVKLPCHYSNNVSKSSVRLILWYKHESGSPFYSYDTRGRSFYDGVHWAEESALGRRATLDSRAVGPQLLLKRVSRQDEGVYRCRVDFRNKPTFNFLLKLVVIVPPEQLELLDQSSGEVVATGADDRTVVIGPYREGTTVNISCSSRGGIPLPNITWWLNSSMAVSHWQRNGNVTSSHLVLVNVDRKLLTNVYTCLASNSNHTEPMMSSLKLDLYLAPNRVRLFRDPLTPGEMSEGQQFRFICEVFGAHPEPVIKWMKNNTELAAVEQSRINSSVSMATVLLSPQWRDDGLQLHCKAHTAGVAGVVLRQSMPLSVQYAPIVKIVLGKSLRFDSILEGRDVYFECHTRANPAVTSIQWFHNNAVLLADKGSGIITSGASLALQRVGITSRGHYSCSAANRLGQVISRPALLDVKYSPRCSRGQRIVYRVPLSLPVHVLCSVVANPIGSLQFAWHFNSSVRGFQFHQRNYSAVNGSSSVLLYVPKVGSDYGSVSCRAANEVGTQTQPCVFHIVPMDNPLPPSQCSESNVSMTSASVTCTGREGALSVSYWMEVIQSDGRALTSWKQTTPTFEINKLTPSTLYRLLVYSENSVGRSSPLEIHLRTLPDSTQQKTGLIISGSSRGVSVSVKWPHTWSLLVALGAGLVTVSVVVLVTCVRRSDPCCRASDPADISHSQEGADKQLVVCPREIPLHSNSCSRAPHSGRQTTKKMTTTAASGHLSNHDLCNSAGLSNYVTANPDRQEAELRIWPHSTVSSDHLEPSAVAGPLATHRWSYRRKLPQQAAAAADDAGSDSCDICQTHRFQVDHRPAALENYSENIAGSVPVERFSMA